MATIDSYVDNLVDERNRAWEAQKELVVKAADEQRELTVDERATITRTDETLDRLDGEIKGWREKLEAARIADESREAVERMVRPAATPAVAEPGPSDSDLFRAFARGDQGAPKAIEIDFRSMSARAVRRSMNPGVSPNVLYRDLLEDVAAAGGTTVPTTFARTLYDFLEVYTGMRRTGATILTTSSGEAMQFPRAATHGTAAAVGEGTALAEADPTFGAMILNAWKFGQLVQVSNELLTDSGVDILGFVARDSARALGRITDTRYVTGTGSSQPMGIMTVAGTATSSVVGGTGVPNYANLIDMVHGVNSEYRMNSPVWLTRDANVGALRKLLDGNNLPLWQPSVQAGVPDRLLGYPVIEDPNVAAFATGATATATSVKGLAFGDFSAFYIRDVQGVRFERSDEFAFSSDMVTFRAILRTDSDLIDTSAVKILIGGTA